MGVLNIVGAFARSSLRYTSGLILPPVCAGCAALISGHSLLCPRCWRDLHLIVPPVCDRTGAPLPGFTGPGPHYSTTARLDPPDYDRARAAAHYAGLMRRLVTRFKFEDRHEPLPLFAALLHQAGRDLIADADVLVPVPLHPLRLLQRRFNQSALLTRALARRTGKPAALNRLRRVKRTVPQVGLSADARSRNVAAAFAAPEGAFSGMRVLLIDDVITTGATVSACALALKDAGARAVDILALALAGHFDDGESGPGLAR